MLFRKKDVEGLNLRDIVALSELMVPEKDIDYYDNSSSPPEFEPFLYNMEQRVRFFYNLADEIKLINRIGVVEVKEKSMSGAELAASKLIFPDGISYDIDSMHLDGIDKGKNFSEYVLALKDKNYYNQIYMKGILYPVISESLKEMRRFEDFEAGVEMIDGMMNSPIYKKLDLIRLQAYRDNMLMTFFDRANSRLAEEIRFDQKVDYNEIVDLEHEIRQKRNLLNI
jgi:hypothetical protein